MDLVSAFWNSHGDLIVTNVVIAVATTAAAAALLWLWRVVWAIVKWVAACIYWLLIGWWVARIRRWVTGSMW